MNSRFDTRHCWCMAMRLDASYRTRSGDANRRSMKKVVDTAAAPPGVLAYVEGVPVGWCAVAPREEFPRVARAAAKAAPSDDAAWSVVCFYVLRSARRQGVSRALLAAAVELATQHGAKVVEGYPVEGGNNPFRGIPSVFTAAGFAEIARPKPNRPIMRYAMISPRKRVSARSADRQLTMEPR
jgi:GNAT superfamily N-acetyltransferase